MGIVNGLEKCTVTNPFRQIIDFLHRRDRFLDFAFESTVENTSLVTPVWASAAHSKVQLGRLPPQIESDDRIGPWREAGVGRVDPGFAGVVAGPVAADADRLADGLKGAELIVVRDSASSCVTRDERRGRDVQLQRSSRLVVDQDEGRLGLRRSIAASGMEGEDVPYLRRGKAGR